MSYSIEAIREKRRREREKNLKTYNEVKSKYPEKWLLIQNGQLVAVESSQKEAMKWKQPGHCWCSHVE